MTSPPPTEAMLRKPMARQFVCAVVAYITLIIGILFWVPLAFAMIPVTAYFMFTFGALSGVVAYLKRDEP